MKEMFAPPASAVPAGEAGGGRKVAACLPPAATNGVADALPAADRSGRGSARRTTSAWRVFCTESASEPCCRPAETREGDALAAIAGWRGFCTDTGEEVTGAGLGAPGVWAPPRGAEPVN